MTAGATKSSSDNGSETQLKMLRETEEKEDMRGQDERYRLVMSIGNVDSEIFMVGRSS